MAQDETGASVTPELSVVIACYNAQGTLGVQLDALARQVDPVPFEVIVCDNGCTDRSIPLALSYRDRLDIRVVDAAARRGPAFARNQGVAQARGPLVAFCDADDEVAETWVAAMAAALRTHDFVAGKVGVERLNDPRVIRSRIMEQREGLQPPITALGFCHAGAGNLGVLRAAFLAVDGFDVDMLACEDTDFCMKMQLAGHRLHYAPEVFIETRLRDQVGPLMRQGYQYGVGQARLEHRYGPPSAALEGGADTVRTVGAAESSGFARLAHRLRTMRSLPLSGQLWQVGWSVGHRIGQRRQRPVTTGVSAGLGRDAAVRS